MPSQTQLASDRPNVFLLELHWKIQEKRQEYENKKKQKLTNKTNIGTPMKNSREETRKWK